MMSVILLCLRNEFAYICMMLMVTAGESKPNSVLLPLRLHGGSNFDILQPLIIFIISFENLSSTYII